MASSLRRIIYWVYLSKIGCCAIFKQSGIPPCTKAQISHKREATACQRNSVYQRIANRAIREREDMAARFGASKTWASQQAVWRATGKMFGWKALNAWLDEHDMLDPLTYSYPTAYNPDRNRHEVIYPRDAWLDVHGVDIAALF